MVRLFFISIVFILLQQSEIVYCQLGLDNNFVDVNLLDTHGVNFEPPPPEGLLTDDESQPLNLEDLSTNLDNYFLGDTFFWSSVSSQYISNSGWTDSDTYFVKFNSGINDFLNGKLLIGSLSKLSQITTVKLTFHDINDNIVQDDNGQPLQYTSSPQDLGHLLQFLHEGFDYSYVQFIFNLLPSSNFKPGRLFFHFAQSSSSSKSTSTSTRESTTTSTSTFTTEPTTTTTEPTTTLMESTTTTIESTTTPMEPTTTTIEPTTTAMESTTSPTEATTTSTSTSTTTTEPTTTSTSTSTSTRSISSPAVATITCPSEVAIYEEKWYGASTNCPGRVRCVWRLDNLTIRKESDNAAKLRFSPSQIGNHTLSFVADINGTYITLASCSLSIIPNLNKVVWLVPDQDKIYGLWNTSAGGNGFYSRAGIGIGQYSAPSPPKNALDRKSNSKFRSFGSCSETSPPTTDCGIKTGLFWTIKSVPSLLLGLQFCTSWKSIERDPLSITIEGSNQNASGLLLGSSWTLIYNGSSGLKNTLSRTTLGDPKYILNNRAWYKSYRLLITSKRGPETSVDYADATLFGHYYSYH